MKTKGLIPITKWALALTVVLALALTERDNSSSVSL